MSSPEYAAAFDEVVRLGGDGVVTPTARTPDQTLAGIYWAYDGTPSLCAPPGFSAHTRALLAQSIWRFGTASGLWVVMPTIYTHFHMLLSSSLANVAGQDLCTTGAPGGPGCC